MLQASVVALLLVRTDVDLWRILHVHRRAPNGWDATSHLHVRFHGTIREDQRLFRLHEIRDVAFLVNSSLGETSALAVHAAPRHEPQRESLVLNHPVWADLSQQSRAGKDIGRA